MNVIQVVTLFIAFWVLTYISVYYIYVNYDSYTVSHTDSVSKDNVITDSNKIRVATNALKSPSFPSSSGLSISHLTNPTLSDVCINAIKSGTYGSSDSAFQSVSVIIVSKDEHKGTLSTTILSILENSGNELKKIVIVDDHSSVPIDTWFKSENYKRGKVEVVVVRPMHHLGVSSAKAYGVEHASSTDNDVIVFVDAHVIVSQSWLLPLVNLLDRHPHSIVYPTIDVLDRSDSNAVGGSIIKSHNVVGAFDWSLAFRWEPVHSDNELNNRIPLVAKAIDSITVNSSNKTVDTSNDELSSPAAPGIFAMKLYYYNEIGGLDKGLKGWGLDSVELSLRTWLSDGAVIRQPCSRVAHQYNNLFEDSLIDHGMTTQGTIDQNVMLTAEHLIDKKFHELVFQHRFLGRIPYKVILPIDSKLPSTFHTLKRLRQGAFNSFDWYMTEVYSGLLFDMKPLQEAYSSYVSSNYLDKMYDSLLTQYKSEIKSVPVKSEVEMMKRHAASDKEQIQSIKLKQLEPKPLQKLLVEKLPPAEEGPHEKHVRLVKTTLVCEDEVILDGRPSCTDMNNDVATNCLNDRYNMMFGCPKTCELCGLDGKICFDFYEKKCVDWAAEGKCDTEDDMKEKCRHSCKICTRADAAAASIKVAAKKKAIPPAAPAVDGGASTEADAGADAGADAAVADGVSIDASTSSKRVDPYIAQQQYTSGLLIEPSDSSSYCTYNGKPHGNLLSNVNIIHKDEHHQAPSVKIFCAIYTMEKNHKTNVDATKRTWAKKCDGFVAFSTVDDLTIPAMKIEHDGDEEYDNMWQKSKSIWKYIAKHYINEFDYFLIGGDDMFYIVENLRYYLNSREIVAYQAKNEGVFIGRRFFPEPQRVFNSGGAGYILDTVSLEVLQKNLDTQKCYPNQRGFWEDVNVAHCLQVSSNILPYDTRDAQERERFHPFTPGQHLTYKIPKNNGDWYPKYNPYLKEGYDCCSTNSISFHYCGADILLSLYNYLYHCPNKVKPHV